MKRYDVEKYDEYCDKIKEIAKTIGKTPSASMLKKYDESIPNSRWFIKNSPTSEIKDYNSLISYIGLKPNYFVTKEFATKIILKKFNENNGVLKKEHFEKANDNSISISVIRRIWGSFNNMLKDLNLPINQENMLEKVKSIEHLEDDIKRLCENLYEKNGHKKVCLDDIIDCEWCSAHTTYNKKFNEHFGMTICEYIESIGYIPNKSGMGMNHTFEDGEFVGSKYEYLFSNLLRKNNIEYDRNIRYDSFIKGYEGNKDCDYVLNINGKVYYIEIAGMLRDCKSITHAHTVKLGNIQQRYLKDLIEKDKMLKESNLNYYILFSHQINDESFLIDFINGLRN